MNRSNGFQISTKFIVNENGSEVLKSFNDYNSGDTVTIKDCNNDWKTGTIKKYDKKEVMYRVVLSTKRYIYNSTSFFDKSGLQYDLNGIRYGTLKMHGNNKSYNIKEYESKDKFPTTGLSGYIYLDKSTGKTYIWSANEYIYISDSQVYYKRDYHGIGYALLEATPEDIHIDDPLRKTIHTNSISYTLYSLSGSVIEKGLTLEELEDVVSSLSKISVSDLDEMIKTGEVIETGETYTIRVTPMHKWKLFNGYPDMFIKEKYKLFERTKYDLVDPNLSGFTWYVDDITIHRSRVEYPWTIINTDTDTFQLENGIVTCS